MPRVTLSTAFLTEVNNPGKPSALHTIRKLLAVSGVVNGLQFFGLLVNYGFPVTLIRVDM